MSQPLCHDAATQAVQFLLVADSTPGLLPRLMQPFARRDLVPDRVISIKTQDLLHVEIAVEAMPGEYVHLVEGNLRQVVGVHSVVRSLTSKVAIAA